MAYLEAIALKRQEELIREEEAAEQAEIELKARREVAEKEKRNKKKQVNTSELKIFIPDLGSLLYFNIIQKLLYLNLININKSRNMYNSLNI